MQSGIIEVRWARPAATTFVDFVMMWSLSTGIVVGVVCFVLSLFDPEAETQIIVWYFEGVWSGLVDMLLVPLLFLMLGSLVAMSYPVFRLLAALTGGLKLRFRDRDGHELRFSCLCLRSFIMLASLCGLFFGLLLALFGLVLLSTHDPDTVSIEGLPTALTAEWSTTAKMLAMPVFLAAYAGLAAVPAFLPFRYITHRRRRAVILDSELAPRR